MMTRISFLKLRSICVLITFIECTLALSSSSSNSSPINDERELSLKRSLYESNPLGETELSDVWLILVCTLAWTVWLVSTYKQAKVDVEPSIFDQQQSIQVTGNVLEVSLGEDADGTRIPVYLALIDYVVECYDPDDDTAKFIPQSPHNHPSSPPREGKTSTEKFKKGVVLEHEPPNPSNTEKYLQIRKCFYTNKLLEVGFANVKVLCLVEDPTTSELWDNYLHKKRQRKMPQNWMQLYTVYFIAFVLIAISLYGGYRTVEHLPPDLLEAGYISLGVGAVLLYPCALLLYNSYCFAQRWFSTRKGTIIHGSERWHCTRIACGIHPISEEEEDANSLQNNSSSVTLRQRNNNKVEIKSLEMPQLHDPSSTEYAPPKPKSFWNATKNEYNVQTLQVNPSTVSSISSAGKSHVTTPGNELLVCQDPTSHLMEAFESMSGLVTSADAEDHQLHKPSIASNNPSSSLQKLGNLRRVSSESRVVAARTCLLGDGVMKTCENPSEQDQVTTMYSA